MASAAPASASSRRTGRGWFVLGWGLLLLGIVAFAVQFFAFHQYVVPWYMPVLATAGLLAMLVGVFQRWTVVRLVGLALALFLTAREWHFLLSASRTPAYAGPVAGQKVPAFSAERAGSGAFTDRDLAGSATVVLFFRGRW